MRVVLIDSTFSEIRSAQGENFQDAVLAFWSSVWKQGWNPDEKILREYGDWTLFQLIDGNLFARGLLKDFLLPLKVSAPPDWSEYDSYLLNGGELEYEQWRRG